MASKCEAKRSRTGDLEAEILREISQVNQLEWIPSAAFADHDHAASIRAVVALIDHDASPPDAIINVGIVHLEESLRQYIYSGVVGNILDRHSRGDSGLHGTVETVSESSRWHPATAMPAEINRLSIEAKDGPVVSQYEMPEKINGHRFVTEVATFLSPVSTETFVLRTIG
jgi:hypothetical protein